MRTLELQLLGGFRALLDDEETAALAKQPRRAALLAYLAIERDVPRERVIALLWPEADNERGRHSLNQAIYFLRRIIGAEWVELRGDRLLVAPSVTTDVQQFEHAVAAGNHAAALQLYRGSLLGGASLAATAEFDMWADARRAAVDRLHRRARRQHIAALAGSGRTQEALQSAEEWARLDPLEDEAHHRYIELLANSGQRGAALRQFDLYRRMLAEQELKPLDETVALVEQLQQGEHATFVAPEPEPPRRVDELVVREPQRVAAPRVSRRMHTLLGTRRGLRTLLLAVFVVNLLESSTENWLAPNLSFVHAMRTQLASAAHWLEGGFRFTNHELTNPLGVIGYSIAYYLALPLLLALVGFALARRTSIRPFRVFALAVTIDYLISLPFFLLFPMPERWWHAPSDAIVLSDRWTPWLIELYRPISALDNSFPSFHVSLSVVLVSLSIIYRLRFRWSVLFIGATIAIATIALGIHWITDAIAGVAAGALAVAIALRIDRGLARTSAPAPPRTARPALATTAAVLAMLVCAPAQAHAQSTITYLEVSLDEETRRADETLRRYLSERTGSAFVPERPLEYDAVIDRLAGWRPEKGYFLARTTPYAFVAAEMLGAQLDPVATYVSTATGGTTYHSYFVVNRERFPYRADLASLVDYLRERTTPATFIYHSKFSTSSYFVPALFFRSHGIYHMANATQYHTAIHSLQYGESATDLVRAVADGTYDLAAVWDGTKSRFEEVDSLRARYGSRVHFIQLPTPLPNDLLVISATTDSVTRGRLEDAIRSMGPNEIGRGDFRTWQHIDAAPAAREALANLRWLARERSPAVTVDVLRSDRGDAVPDDVLEAARQAVRLASAEFVNYDNDFHAHRDYVWTIERVRDGTIALTSRIVGSDLDDQRFQLSYRDEEELTRRIGDLVHSRLHRIRYIWAYRPERPTIIRDIDFELPPGTEVRVRRIHWLDAQRNHFQEDAEFIAHVQHSDFFKFELQPAFISDADDGFGFDPMSNISYRVILVRQNSEPAFFRVLTVILLVLLIGAAATAIAAARRTPAPA